MSWIREHELIQKKAIHEFIIREITSTRTNELKKKPSKWEFCHWRTSNTRKSTVFILFHLFTISFNSIEFRTHSKYAQHSLLLTEKIVVAILLNCVHGPVCVRMWMQLIYMHLWSVPAGATQNKQKKYNNSINKSILMTFMFVVCGQNSVLASADNSWPAKPRAHKAVTNQREPEQNKKNTKWSEKQVACRQCTETRSPGMSWEPHTNTHEHSLQNWAE